MGRRCRAGEWEYPDNGRVRNIWRILRPNRDGDCGHLSTVFPWRDSIRNRWFVLTERERMSIAEEIVRRIDAVALLKVEEVQDIRKRALAGEFDEFEGEMNENSSITGRV